MSHLDPVDRAVPPDLRVLYKPLDNVQNGGCHLDIWAPERDEGKPVPLAMYLHGGAFCLGASSSIPYRQVRWLRERGVAVASIEYRMLPHADLPVIRSDILDAYRFVIDGSLNGALLDQEWQVDTTRVSGWGASAGGAAVIFMAADAIAAKLPPLRAIVPVYPMADTLTWGKPNTRADIAALMETDAQFKDAYDFLMARPAVTGQLWAADGEDKSPELVAAETHCGALMSKDLIVAALVGDPPYPESSSPLHLLSAQFPPTFVVIGTADDLCLPEKSHALVDKLKGLGVDAVAGEAVGMGHGPAEAHQSNGPWPAGNAWWETAMGPSLEFVLKYLTEE